MVNVERAEVGVPSVTVPDAGGEVGVGDGSPTPAEEDIMVCPLVNTGKADTKQKALKIVERAMIAQ